MRRQLGLLLLCIALGACRQRHWVPGPIHNQSLTVHHPQPPPAPVTDLVTTMNGFTLTVSHRSGNLLRLSHPHLGTILEAPENEGGLLALSYPITEFLPLQLASRGSTASVRRDQQGVRIDWDSLQPNRDNLLSLATGAHRDVHTTATITPTPEGDGIVFTVTIRNSSPVDVFQVVFPDLAGLKPVAGTATCLQARQNIARRAVVYGFQRLQRRDRTTFYPLSTWRSYPLAPAEQGWLYYGGCLAGQLGLWILPRTNTATGTLATALFQQPERTDGAIAAVRAAVGTLALIPRGNPNALGLYPRYDPAPQRTWTLSFVMKVGARPNPPEENR